MELALYGGQPVRGTRLNYGRQYIDESDIKAVEEVLRSDFLTCGPKIGALEARLREVTGARHAAAVSNGTAALHVACLAAGIGAGDEVIVSPITFAASANCVLYCGGRPVFADIDAETWNISPESIEKRITGRTKAVVAVDFTGQAVRHDEIRAICDKHHLLLIEDAAHAIGTTYNGRPVGSLADLTTFSFHPVKTVTCGEGGAVTTNSDALAARVGLFRAHGITRDPALLEQKDAGAWYYEQQELGYNYRLTDIQAALCLSQLDKLARFSARRRELVERYDEAFSQMPELTVQREIPQSGTTRHLYIIRLNSERLKAPRKLIFEALQAENIGVNVHYQPVYYLPYYQGLGYQKGICPNAEALYEEMITLPLHYCMTDGDLQDVVGAVRKVLAYFKR